IARQNVEAAGLAGKIHVERRELAFFEAAKVDAPGVVLCNPPYGERLGEAESLRYLYRCLGRKLKQHVPGFRCAVITNNIELADALAMQSSVAPYRLYNGGLPVFLKISEVPAWIPERHQALSPVATKNEVAAQDFYNRLEKNLKNLRKEAEKLDISCYRIYDADLPDYNFAIDLYENKIHLQEYAPPKSVDPEKAEKRVQLAVEALKALFRISENQIFFKVRKRQKGTSQYTKQAGDAKLFEIKEGIGLYLINLSDYLDSGVFLDHRLVRELIYHRAKGKRFLNLFAYTATATVQAALGQARNTVSVDMSPNYTKWARSNFCLNGFSETNHRLEVADCMKWLHTSKDQFDLILLDPPTFSNSKRTENVLDVQRDHVELIQLAMRRLEPGGELIFSNNYRKFKLDEEALLMFDVQPMSENTIPFDFKRKGNIHQCWSIKHRQRRKPLGSEE
ncbi:MAG TPA: bifunctional 23S rRNA (guanine(2069)-N(7))-methyltransferase RlmK/23S rRNA (guanine(2445)-N(2))-methyltransferase RlmL, partial [Pseudomonadales bacterium]|nr:bifunctional 23S rRNA (guanine(2069)-N(7))-methyltransferase RlmK/23S rRNA (guanine(2445)-N(2))-methyltransferase RlmL [Pseudomonadales bacterium]